jgi:type IV pilus assembly protein PilC
MPEFLYIGVDKEGKKAEGKLEATDEGQVRVMLRGMGVRPTRINKAGALQRDLGSLLSRGGTSMSIEELVIFTRQLQVLISSGVPLVQSLEILGEQAARAGSRSMILAIKEKVSSGTYLWQALSEYPKAFPKLFISLIRAGESSGSMDVMLKRLTRYLEDNDRLQKLVKSALMYPAIVVSIGLLVVLVMLGYVIPKFESLLAGSGQELPGPTKFVIDLSHFIVDYFYAIAGGLGGGGYFGFTYFKSPEGRAFRDRVLFRAPIFGNLMQKSGVARFSRTMTTLLGSGVALIDAIDICRSTIDNAVLEEAVGGIRSQVESGKSLGSVVHGMSVFPKMAVHMISVGENTGALDRMLEKVADFYEAEVESMVNGLTKLIEPLILVFLGGSVGGLLIAMYLPIFKMAGGVSGGE